MRNGPLRAFEHVWLAEAGDSPARDVLRLGPAPLRDKARRNAAIEVLTELARARIERYGRREILARSPALQSIMTASKRSPSTWKPFEDSVAHMINTIETAFPSGTQVTRPRGGYLLWVELPGSLRSRYLFERALGEGICFVPGDIFSASGRYGNCLRLSCGHSWSPVTEEAVRRLGELANELPTHAPTSDRNGHPPHLPPFDCPDQGSDPR